jgi:DNA-binding MarR family transcriptional regulator
MTSSKDYTQDQVDAIRSVIQQAWLMLQTEYEKTSSGCIPMTMGDRQVLKMVAAKSDIILREIREALGMPNSTLTSAIDRLEDRGLVHRTVSKRDRRSYGLELTPGGRAYMQLQNQAEEAFAVHVLDVLETEADRRSFIDSLSKVIANLG